MLNQGEVGMQGPPGGPGPVGPKVIFQKQNKILLKPYKQSASLNLPVAVVCKL